MKRAKKTKSMTVKMWTYFSLFTLLILVLFWLLEIVMINMFFTSMKTAELRGIGEDIIRKYEEAGTSSEFEEALAKDTFRNGVWLEMVDTEGNVVFGSNSYFRQSFENNFDTIKKMLEKSKNYTFTYDVSFKAHEPKGERDGFIKSRSDDREPKREHRNNGHPETMKAVCYAARLEGADGNTEGYIYLSTAVREVDITLTVLSWQLVIVSVISLLIASVFAYFIARRLARPIKNMASESEKLAGGDYSVSFKKGSYSEINELSDVLNKAADEMRKTDSLRRDLISNVSHDLKTPLTIIKSYAEMIHDISGENPDKRNEHTKVIIDESDRLSRLVDDMLDLSKYESDVIRLECESFDLGELSKSICLRFEYLVLNEGYKIFSDFDKDCVVFADKRKIEQVIYNLIINAVNYTGEDKTVYVSVKRENEGCRFFVRDTGEGIPDGEIDFIFDRYYRASSMRNRKGSGIGLAIVKNILTLHGFEFGAKSTPGEGSVFWFEIKKAPDDSEK